jgi:hypothetical protein
MYRALIFLLTGVLAASVFLAFFHIGPTTQKDDFSRVID